MNEKDGMMKARSKLVGKQGGNGRQGELGEQGQQGEQGQKRQLRGPNFGSLFTFKYSLWRLFIFLQIEGCKRGFNVSLFEMLDHLFRYY